MLCFKHFRLATNTQLQETHIIWEEKHWRKTKTPILSYPFLQGNGEREVKLFEVQKKQENSVFNFQYIFTLKFQVIFINLYTTPYRLNLRCQNSITEHNVAVVSPSAAHSLSGFSVIQNET